MKILAAHLLRSYHYEILPNQILEVVIPFLCEAAPNPFNFFLPLCLLRPSLTRRCANAVRFSLLDISKNECRDVALLRLYKGSG